MNRGNAIAQDHRMLWLSMLHQPDWWTARRLTLLWAPTFTLEEVERMLQALVNGGFVLQRAPESHRGERVPTFSVTDDCLVLPGIVQRPERMAA
ncbi:hypothetical protein ACO2Q9_02730 [Variovorax sp. VNK109]|uniref:hypothetical protein n=1 Tax=Variovorax sp. VNK109 TaxID=3400919 RepID=UPI003C05E978